GRLSRCSDPVRVAHASDEVTPRSPDPRSWFTALGKVSNWTRSTPPCLPSAARVGGYGGGQRRNSMALTMSDKQAARKDRSEWPAELQGELAREACSPNGCVGSELVSENDKVRVWTIRLKPGQRFGFHRHVLDYFWTAITPCRGRQHLVDGTTVEYTYTP